MKDRYLFRGRLVSAYGEQKWVQGDLYSRYAKNGVMWILSHSNIKEAEPDKYEVDPATIGQCTEILDKNEVIAYGGDIVKTKFFGKDNGSGQNFSNYDTFVVTWHNGGFCLENGTENEGRRFGVGYMADNPEAFEIIGNIHDNPELLNEKAAQSAN